MPTYLDILKSLESEQRKRVEAVLPQPIEEIFPDLQENPAEKAHQDLMKRDYQSLVEATLECK